MNQNELVDINDDVPAALRADYCIESVLGRGAMGRVYRARLRHNRYPVAVKLLAGGAEATMRKRFLREHELLMAVTHPNVLRVLDLGEVSGRPFLVTELHERNLASHLRAAGPMAVKPAVKMILDVLAGLGACHRAGIVHRDVKPSNILVSTHGRAIIADLGIGRKDSDLTWLTRTGAILGTPAYMSPEQARGENVGPASDLYSAAAVLYELLSGQRPFQSTSVAELMVEILQREPPALERLAPSIPANLAAVISQALAKHPGERPRSARELGGRINVAAGGRATGAVCITERLPEQKPRPARAQGWGFALLLAGATLARSWSAVPEPPPRPGPVAWTTAVRATPASARRTPPPLPPRSRLAPPSPLPSGICHPGVTAAAFSPDRHQLATGSADGLVRLWDLNRRQVSRQLNTEAPVAALDFSQSTGRLVTAHFLDDFQLQEDRPATAALQFWTLATGQRSGRCGFAGRAGDVRIAPGATFALLRDAARCQDGVVDLDALEVRPITQYLPQRDPQDIFLARRAIGIRKADRLTLVSPSPLRVTGRVRPSRHRNYLALSANGLFTAWTDGESLEIATVPEGQVIATVRATAAALLMAPDGQHVAFLDATVRGTQLWGPGLARPVTAPAPGYPLAFSPDGSLLALGTANGLIFLVDGRTGAAR